MLPIYAVVYKDNGVLRAFGTSQEEVKSKNPAVDVNDTADHSLPFMENKVQKHYHACSECRKHLLNKLSLQPHVREVFRRG